MLYHANGRQWLKLWLQAKYHEVKVLIFLIWLGKSKCYRRMHRSLLCIQNSKFKICVIKFFSRRKEKMSTILLVKSSTFVHHRLINQSYQTVHRFPRSLAKTTTTKISPIQPCECYNNKMLIYKAIENWRRICVCVCDF